MIEEDYVVTCEYVNKRAKAKWDEKDSALQTLKDWFDTLDKECKETERLSKQEKKD